MTKTAVGNENEEDGSRLLRAVEAIAISPKDATSIAEQYLNQSKDRFPDSECWNHQLRAADKIIGRYSRLAAMVGTATGLPGIIPGLGTAVAIVGGAAADSLACMKLQVDMCMCLAAAFKYDITSEDGKHLAFLIAATGSAQRAGVEAGARLGSQAGVRMLRQYLKGAALKRSNRRSGGLGLPLRGRLWKRHSFWDRSGCRWRSQLWADSIERGPSGQAMAYH